jgi:hypothetical protein
MRSVRKKLLRHWQRFVNQDITTAKLQPEELPEGAAIKPLPLALISALKSKNAEGQEFLWLSQVRYLYLPEDYLYRFCLRIQIDPLL